MEIICVNDTFSVEWLAWASLYQISTPRKDVIYNIRDVVKMPFGGKTGILLDEITNPLVPVVSPMGNEGSLEPSFDIDRFATLAQESLTRAILEEFAKEKRNVTQY